MNVKKLILVPHTYNIVGIVFVIYKSGNFSNIPNILKYFYILVVLSNGTTTVTTEAIEDEKTTDSASNSGMVEHL